MPSEKQLLHNLFCNIINSKNEKTDYIMELDRDNQSVFLLTISILISCERQRKD